MNTKMLLAVAMAGALCLSGCKIVKTSDAQGGKAAATGEAGEDAHIRTVIADTYDSKLLVLLRDKATDAKDLETAIKAGLDAAGEAHGVKVGGAGGAWNFAVKGTAVILDVNRQSKAGTLKLDIAGTGKEDADLQIGPVVMGTALRDIAPFYDFTQFRDQIEFAKLARALNTKATSGLTLPEGDLKGKHVTFLGAVAVSSAGGVLKIVPVSVEIAP